MIEIELEKTYLMKSLPTDLAEFPHHEILDIYLPAEAVHPTLRLRKRGDSYAMTKKSLLDESNASESEEHTIKLTKAEFDSLAIIHGKRVRKNRYAYVYKGYDAEIDVFEDDLKGLVMADFEFKTIKEKNAFGMPDFCLVEVTDDETFAGGMLCGKKYADIEGRLKELGYDRIMLS